MLPKVLFLSEAVTSAHFLRPWNLAKILIKNNYDVYFASTHYPLNIAKDDRIKCYNLSDSVSSKIFLDSIRWGKLPYSYKVVSEKLNEDLKIIGLVKPDIIIDDFRLTSSIASEKLNLKHITLCNLNWLPNFCLNTEVIPELEQFKIFGNTLGMFAY